MRWWKFETRFLVALHKKDGSTSSPMKNTNKDKVIYKKGKGTGTPKVKAGKTKK
jgi:hypothetical protein